MSSRAPGQIGARWAPTRELVHTVFQGVTVLTAVAALLFTARSLDYTADATSATRQQMHLSEQGQISDRFGKAVDQLGQEGENKLSIRLGGIYALERVMRDSADDEPTVIEVLCAFIRTHAPSPLKTPEHVNTSSLDVRAAVTVLARRPNPNANQNQRLDLADTLLGLPGVALSGAHLARTSLFGADLLRADLSGADLSGADLRHANLGGANLQEANLSGAGLIGADLPQAKLSGTNLIGANLINADLQLADLRGADLRGADLRHVDLRGANLSTTNLRDANLDGANVDAATLLPHGVARPTPSPTR